MDKKLKATIATNIKKLRESKDMSAEKLAEEAGLSRQTIHNIEHELVPKVAVDTLLKIGAALGVKSIDTIIKDELTDEIVKALDLVHAVEKRYLAAESPAKYVPRRKKRT